MSTSNAVRGGPGIVVVGLPANAQLAALVARLSARGYAVEALESAARTPIDTALDDVQAAMARVRSLPAAHGKVAVIAYGAAGVLAFLAVTRLAADGAAIFCGAGIAPYLGESRFARVPMSMHFNDADPAVPPADVRAMKGALEGIGIIDIYRYEGWDAAAAELAERRACEVLDTLSTRLG